MCAPSQRRRPSRTDGPLDPRTVQKPLENIAAACTVGGVASLRGGDTKSERLLLAAGILAALVLAGCAGYTEVATDIGRSSATLNGGGKAGPERHGRVLRVLAHRQPR